MEFELEGADRQQERIKREVGIVGILYEVGFTHFYLIHYSCKTNSTTTLLVRTTIARTNYLKSMLLWRTHSKHSEPLLIMWTTKHMQRGTGINSLATELSRLK